MSGTLPSLARIRNRDRRGAPVPRVAAILAVAPLLVAACGGGGPATLGPTDPPGRSPAPTAAASPTPVPPATPAPTAAASTEPAGLAPGEPWLAYQSGGRFGYGIYLLRPDGTDVQFPIRGVPVGVQEHPEWSPDGSRLLFTVIEGEDDGSETEDIWLADTATWEVRRLVDCEAPCTWADEPAWSPDGATIAFQRLVEGDGAPASTLELLDVASGTARVLVTAPAARVILAPRWSPDGRRIVVELLHLADDPVGDVIGDALAVVDLGAAAPALAEIVPPDRFANNPDWSPVGDLVVFSAPGEGGEPGGRLSDLWTVRPDGSRPTRVTDLASGGGTAIHPTFTPDGARILFVGDDPAAGRMSVVFAVRPDGSDLSPATPTSVTGTHPRLRPTP